MRRVSSAPVGPPVAAVLMALLAAGAVPLIAQWAGGRAAPRQPHLPVTDGHGTAAPASSNAPTARALTQDAERKGAPAATVRPAMSITAGPTNSPGLPAGGVWTRQPRPGGETWEYRFTVPEQTASGVSQTAGVASTVVSRSPVPPATSQPEQGSTGIVTVERQESRGISASGQGVSSAPREARPTDAGVDVLIQPRFAVDGDSTSPVTASTEPGIYEAFFTASHFPLPSALASLNPFETTGWVAVGDDVAAVREAGIPYRRAKSGVLPGTGRAGMIAAASRASGSVAARLASRVDLVPASLARPGLSAFDINLEGFAHAAEVASAGVALKISHPSADQLTVWLSAEDREIVLWDGRGGSDDADQDDDFQRDATIVLDRVFSTELKGLVVGGHWTLFVSNAGESAGGTVDYIDISVHTAPLGSSIANPVAMAALDAVAESAYLRTAANGGAQVTVPAVGQSVFFYLDWTLAGSGSASVSVRALIDGATHCSGTVSGTGGVAYTAWCSTGWTATAGSHTLRWDLDDANAIAETNETNNSATRTWTSGGGVDLAADRAYLRTAPNGGSEVTTPAVGQAVHFHLDWQITGSGSGIVVSSRAVFDGVTFCGGSLTASAGTVWTTWCTTAWTAAAGSHTLRWDLDYGNSVAESSETNNSASATWTSGGVDIEAQRAYLRSAANGGTEVTTPTVGQTVFFHVDWRVTGSGSAITVAERALLDGTVMCSGSTSVNPGTVWITWCTSGWTATAGSHTLRWEFDYSNAVTETNESNNVATATWTSAAALDVEALRAYLRTAANGGGTEVTAPTVGQWVYFHLDWRVTGSGAAVGVNVRAVLDGATFCSGGSTVSPGDSITSWCTWIATAGSHTLRWDLDYTNAVSETNESNNSASRTFTSVLTDPQLDVTPASHDFGSVAVGGSSDRTFVVRNTGGGTLTGTVTIPQNATAATAVASRAPLSAAFSQMPRVSQTAAAVPDEVLVMFRPGTSQMQSASIHAVVGVDTIERFSTPAGLELVKVTNVKEAIERYRQHADVVYAEPNYMLQATVMPGDARFGDLWGLHNTGQNGGTADADIDAPAAWDLTTGSSSVVVAVIDSGIDYTHPDLAGNIFRNTADCNTNGVDDDGNGYVDDCYGIDTVNNDSNPMDDQGHGTHVAGTIGALGNNSLGVVGVNWNVRLMPCKFVRADGTGPTSAAIACLQYVATMKARGVDVVATNNSYGGGSFSQALRDAIDAQRTRGILFIAAAGNGDENGAGIDNDLVPHYPASYDLPHVLAVAATTRTDSRSSSSNFGRHTVHLGAPGSEILSTLPNNTYGTASGTSMATPHVAGVAALLKAHDPSRDWRAIKNLILAGGDVVSGLENTITGRRLNAFGSLSCTSASVTSRIAPVGRQVVTGVGVPLTLRALNIRCAAPNGNVSVTVNPGGSVVTLVDDGQSPDQVASDGSYSAQWTPPSAGAFTLTFPGGDLATVSVLTNYTPTSTTYSYRTIQGTSLNLGDDQAARLTPPFPVNFGGTNFADVYVSSNGVVSVTGPVDTPENTPIPTSQATTLVAPFWDDLYAVAGSTPPNVFWQTLGTAPNRELVIEWRDVRSFTCRTDTAATVKFQVIFFEGRSDILFNYADTGFGGSCASADRGGSATVGVQVSGALGRQYSHNTQSVSDNTAVLWTTASSSNPFAIVSGSTFSLTAGGSHSVVVRFAPPAAADFSRSVEFTSNAGSTSRPVTGRGVVPAEITSPTPGSTFTSLSVTFQWSAGQNVAQYWLYVGSTAGGSDIYNVDQAASRSVTVHNIPTDGRRIHVRLWSRSGATWHFRDYTYTAATITPAPAEITAPSPGATFTSSSVTFEWSTGTAVSQYWLYVGSTAGGLDVYSADQGTSLNRTVTRIPIDGRRIFVRLWSRIGSTWHSRDYTYTAATITPAAAELTAPGQDSTCSGPSVTFEWSTGTAVSRYWLDVGSTSGGFDIYSADQGTSLSRTVTNIPIDGRRIFVRLWSLLPSGWAYRDYSCTAATITPVAAEITAPRPDSTFSGTSVTFEWSTGTAVSRYWLDVGSTAGGFDIYRGDQGTNLSRTVTTLPTDGRRVYVRLWSWIGSTWLFSDYTYTAADWLAAITAPAPGSTLTSSSVTFQWSAGTGVTQYWLYVGTTAVGSRNVYSEDQGANRSALVNDLPINGGTLYVRLWSLMSESGRWQFRDYTYTAVTLTAEPAAITAPTPGSPFTSSSVTFEWNTGTGVSEYWVSVGSTTGGRDIYNASQGRERTRAVTNIPTDGRQIFVRLWSRMSGTDQWEFRDYTYTAADWLAAITAPAPGSTLTSPSATFEWSTGTNVTQYWLYVGSALGGKDLYDADQGTNRSRAVTNLPIDGRRLFVRLWSRIGSTWHFRDYTYTATGTASTPGEITTPTPGSTLTSSSVTFQWSAGSNVVQYWLSVGTTGTGSANIYYADQGVNRSATVNNLPTGGGTIYVRLWSLLPSGWAYRDYQYNAAATTSPAEITSPTPGWTFREVSFTFQWSSGTDVSQYWLYVGTSGVGSNNIYNTDQGVNRSALVNNLPTNGSTIYVRLSSRIGSTWHSRDYAYTAASGVPAEITSPTPGSRLTSSSVTFAWTAGTNVTQYWLSVGTTYLATDIYGGSQGTNRSATVSNVGNNGGTLFVQLKSLIGSTLHVRHYTYRQPGTFLSGDITSPTPGSTLTSSSVTFEWTRAAGASRYYLQVGSCIGCRDIRYDVQGTTNVSATVTNLPTDGRFIHVDLTTLYPTLNEAASYMYRAASSTLAGDVSDVSAFAIAELSHGGMVALRPLASLLAGEPRHAAPRAEFDLRDASAISVASRGEPAVLTPARPPRRRVRRRMTEVGRR